MKHLWVVLALLGLVGGGSLAEAHAKPPSSKPASSDRSGKKLHRIYTPSVKHLREFFHTQHNTLPWLSAHRGGPAPGYPENALETFGRTLSLLYALIECDVRESKDGRLFLLHDSRLDRTTTGKGYAHEKTWKTLQSYHLVGPKGRSTPFRIPSLQQTLSWARDKTILFLDVKNRLWRKRNQASLAQEKRMYQKVIQAVQKAKAHAYVVLITYNLRQARLVHRLDPTLMISASLRSVRQIRDTLRWIPANRLVAFAGVPGRNLKLSVYRRLRREGIPTLLGMFRLEHALHRLPVSQKGRGSFYKTLYYELWRKGVAGFATDHIDLAAQALRPLYRKAQRLASPYVHGWHRFYR